MDLSIWQDLDLCSLRRACPGFVSFPYAFLLFCIIATSLAFYRSQKGLSLENSKKKV